MQMQEPFEFKITPLRETVTPSTACTTPDMAWDYWNMNIKPADWFDCNKECLVVLALNCRRKIIGHNLVSIGTADTVLMHPREVFRPVIIAGGVACIVMHNHPSGEQEPSTTDVRGTRDLIRGGQLLKIEMLDHIVVGNRAYSMREQIPHIWT